jgi:hypothetical protein
VVFSETGVVSPDAVAVFTGVVAVIPGAVAVSGNAVVVFPGSAAVTLSRLWSTTEPSRSYPARLSETAKPTATILFHTISTTIKTKTT